MKLIGILGGMSAASTQTYYRQMCEITRRRLVDQGADCMILGCTEVGMLLDTGNVSVPVFDTALIHCESAIERALAP